MAGLSGSGKSTILEQLKRNLVLLNPNENFEILSFEFEMLAQDQVSRSISGRVDKSTKELFSANDYVISDEEMKEIREVAQQMHKFPVYYIDTVGTVSEIKATIVNFYQQRQLAKYNKSLVVTLDHTLLTKGRLNQGEKQKVDELMQSLVHLKKSLVSDGVKVLFVVLSQLNRELEKPERINNSNLHFPNRNDIFAASSVYYCSDYVIITHKPALIDGINSYGPPTEKHPNGLPIFNPLNPSQPMIYWHLIKGRFSDIGIIPMVDELSRSKISEFSKS